MRGTVDNSIAEAPDRILASEGIAAGLSSTDAAGAGRCFHCGEPCRGHEFTRADKVFCCRGCQAVHDILSASGLDQFYRLASAPGVRVRNESGSNTWAYLDDPAVQKRLLDFTDGKLSLVTLKVPGIHCIACVWLLENLFRLHPGIGTSQVNFPRREVAVSFAPAKIAFSEVAALLTSIGYEPQFTLAELDKLRPGSTNRRLWLQVGVAGFAFGNIMLLSIPVYLGLDSFSAPLFKALFGYASLALAVPVLCYCASDYWHAARLAVRQRMLTLDVPIALGLAALYVQSAVEIVSGRGAGYLDSLAGLVFFLLCGRIFQQKTFARIAFDRDYRCFFPLSVLRKRADEERSVALSELRSGDRIVLRNGELIPADSELIHGSALIDYSFVTGESEPVARAKGDRLYAGGKQLGEMIEVEMVKDVSQGYLASLWDHAAFGKQSRRDLETVTNRYSRRFTGAVMAIALSAGVFWCLSGQAARGLKAFTSVLIVACPCALALAAPFALGTTQRWLARRGIFLKNTLVLERLANVDTIVFDKTGTLTSGGASRVNLHPFDSGLSDADKSRFAALARHSTHPHSARIQEVLAGNDQFQFSGFNEVPGGGVEANLDGRSFRLGSANWLRRRGLAVPEIPGANGSASYAAIDSKVRAGFVLHTALRPRTEHLLGELSPKYDLALLSGDNEKEREKFRRLFGSDARLRFNQSPFEKLAFVEKLQGDGRTVMMVGDGLNDAGALKQSDVGVAVVEQVGTFSPASDIILPARDVPRLARLLELARRSVRVVRVSFGISAVYNLAGITIAAGGMLSPVVCAVLMPLSSISVVLFACGSSSRAVKKTGLNPLPD
ncbi:MAG TPA: heavy metal translocating P-type ATPase metal-binding domain-containing protein [Verrucomicrobiae bacterium]